MGAEQGAGLKDLRARQERGPSEVGAAQDSMAFKRPRPGSARPFRAAPSQATSQPHETNSPCPLAMGLAKLGGWQASRQACAAHNFCTRACRDALNPQRQLPDSATHVGGAGVAAKNCAMAYQRRGAQHCRAALHPPKQPPNSLAQLGGGKGRGRPVPWAMNEEGQNPAATPSTPKSNPQQPGPPWGWQGSRQACAMG